MDVEKQIDYWEKSAEHDLDTAEALFKEKKFDWALFMGRQVLEKILKAVIVKKKAVFPPKTHNLVLLLKELDFQMSDEDIDFFEEVYKFKISTRYPDEQLKFCRLCTKEFSSPKFKEIKKKYHWLKGELK